MKFFFLVVFLVVCFATESARAEKFNCPSGEELSKIVSAVEDAPVFGIPKDELIPLPGAYFWVNNAGVYVDYLGVWKRTSMKYKLEWGNAAAIYQQCYLFKKSEWSPAIEFFDTFSGKKIGQITSEGRYREY